VPRLCKAGELWEITQDGVRLVIVADGKQTIRKFISVDHAKVQHDKLVADKLAAGWELTTEGPALHPDGEPREPVLEAAIVADPFDRNAYAVYGDWYQARHHPRGELIALQLAEEREHRPRVRDAIEKHIARHREVLMGNLARYGDSPFGWRFGFIHRLAVADDDPAPELVKALLRHPSGRVLTEAALRVHDARSLARALDELAVASNLRELSIVTGAQLISLDGLARFTKLRALTVKSYGASPQAGVLAAIARIAPTLGSLDLLAAPMQSAWDELAPLFARTDLTLDHLGMRMPELVDPMLSALADSPLAAHVVSLDISQTDPDDGVRALLANRERFATLRTIELSLDRIVPRVASALRAAGIELIDAADDPDAEEYFDEVGE